MNRVLTSFTRGEKGIIAFVLAMIGVGYGILDYQERQREVTVFQVREDRADGSAVPVLALPKGVRPEGQIDVNTADKAVLETLPGVGPAMADRIMQHRTQNGPMHSMTDLDAVPGIGPAMMAKLSPLVAFNEAGTTGAVGAVGGLGGAGGDGTAMPVSGVVPVAAGIAPAHRVMPQIMAPAQIAGPGVVAADGPVNINTAGPEELDRLNGVGPALAQRIILDRQRMGPYRSAQDLMRVKGIGPAILRKNLGKITTQ